MEEEQWKAVEGYEGLYEVSNLGQVRRIKSKGVRGGLLKVQLDCNGYLRVSLCKESKSQTIKIHRLVGKAFLNKTDFKQTYIDHINRIKTDNRASNLRWVSPSQNLMNVKVKENNKSGYTGVRWSKKYQRWIANIRVNGKVFHGGNFINLEDAIVKRQELEKQYFGEYAVKQE